MTTDASVAKDLALVTRTEYSDQAVRVRRFAHMTLLVGSVPVLGILAATGVDPGTVALIVGGTVTASFAARFFGPLPHARSAVRLGLVDGQILIGTERDGDIARPVTDLTDVAFPREPSPVTHIAPDQGELRISGIRSLQLTFRDGLSYNVALLDSDPVAAELVRRLRNAVPEKLREHKQKKPARHQAAPADSATKTPEAGTAQPSASPAADIRLWEAAGVAHRRVLFEYGAYELDPALYLRYPGVTDITREPVMDFHAALEEAQALATDDYPGDADYAGRYRGAVETLRRAWLRCERDGKSTGTSYLSDDDSSDLETAAKLYKHAQATDQPAEKVAYLQKVQQIVVELDGRGRVHLPAPVVNAIETQVRRALGPGVAG